MLGHAIAALLVSALTPAQVAAVNPPVGTETDTATAMSSIAADPHLAWLEALEARGPVVRQHSIAVRLLLEQRATFARQFATAPAELRGEITRELDRVDLQLDIAETAMEDALAATTPDDGPYYLPPEPVDVDALRASAIRRRRPVYLPIPQPAALPPLPAPARESLYLRYLEERSGSSEFARHMVDDAARLMRQRRELAYRHFQAPADQRAVLETALAAVSRRLRVTTQAITETTGG